MDSKFLNGDDGIVIDVNEIADGSITDAKLQSGVTTNGEANKIVKINSGGVLRADGGVGIGADSDSTNLLRIHDTSANFGPFCRLTTANATGGTDFSVIQFGSGRYTARSGGNRTNAEWQYGLAQTASPNEANDRIYFGRSGVSSSDLCIFRDGKIGINTSTAPTDQFYVTGSSYFNGAIQSNSTMTITTSGNTPMIISGGNASVIPYTTPYTTTSSLSFRLGTGTYNQIATTTNSDAAWQMTLYQAGTGSAGTDRFFIGRTNLREDISIFRDGNVSVGYNSSVPGHKFYVHGGIGIGNSGNLYIASGGKLLCQQFVQNQTADSGVRFAALDCSWWYNAGFQYFNNKYRGFNITAITCPNTSSNQIVCTYDVTFADTPFAQITAMTNAAAGKCVYYQIESISTTAITIGVYNMDGSKVNIAAQIGPTQGDYRFHLQLTGEIT